MSDAVPPSGLEAMPTTSNVVPPSFTVEPTCSLLVFAYDCDRIAWRAPREPDAKYAPLTIWLGVTGARVGWVWSTPVTVRAWTSSELDPKLPDGAWEPSPPKDCVLCCRPTLIFGAFPWIWTAFSVSAPA